MSCKCQWLEARKLDAFSSLEVLYKGEWIPEKRLKIVKKNHKINPLV